MKKYHVSFIVGILLLFWMPSSFAVGADTAEPERILETRELKNGCTEVYFYKDGEYYRSIRQNEHLIRTEKLFFSPTGLLLNTEIPTSDEELSDILRERFRGELPASLDYSQSEFLPPVGKQEENSCVGWSTGYYLRTYQEAKDYGWSVREGDKPNSDTVFSPTFIYNQINHGTDNGSSLESAGSLLKFIGAATLSKFPYVPKDYLTQPTEDVIQSAYPHRIRRWRVLMSKYDSEETILRRMKEYLNTGDLFVAGIQIGFKFQYPFMDEQDNAVVTTDLTANFGHAVAVVGYDDHYSTPDGTGVVKIINSFGKEWGKDGFAYMSYPAFLRALRAGYVYTDILKEELEEAPEYEQEWLNAKIEEGVQFQVQFRGKGMLNFEIRSEDGTKILSESKKLDSGEFFEYYWDGTNEKGYTVADGSYVLLLNGKSYPFIKKAKLGKFACVKKKYVDRELIAIEVMTKEMGNYTLWIEVGDQKKMIIEDQLLNAEEEYHYEIPVTNDIDWKNAKLRMRIIYQP